MTDHKPSFSIVLPTHNRADLLPRAVHSVMRQTLKDFELLLVDDGSEDTTPQVAASFKDPRIRIFRREASGGAAAARNHGIRHARGSFVSFLDDDDEYLPTFLQETRRTLLSSPPTVGFAWCGAQVIQDTPEGEQCVLEGVWQPSFSSRREAQRTFLLHRKVGTGGLTIRLRCLQQVGLFDEVYRRAEDTDLIVRLAREFDFAVIPKTLIKVHHHPGPRLTTHGIDMAVAYERLIAKNGLALEEDSQAWFELHYKAAWLYYHGGERRLARSLLRRALRQGWFRPRALLVFLLFELSGSRGPALHRFASRCKDRLAGWLSS